jgi:hypothetical protein
MWVKKAGQSIAPEKNPIRAGLTWIWIFFLRLNFLSFQFFYSGLRIVKT